jgi:hypothetical protein
MLRQAQRRTGLNSAFLVECLLCCLLAPAWTKIAANFSRLIVTRESTLSWED